MGSAITRHEHRHNFISSLVDVPHYIIEYVQSHDEPETSFMNRVRE